MRRSSEESSATSAALRPARRGSKLLDQQDETCSGRWSVAADPELRSPAQRDAGAAHQLHERQRGTTGRVCREMNFQPIVRLSGCELTGGRRGSCQMRQCSRTRERSALRVNRQHDRIQSPGSARARDFGGTCRLSWDTPRNSSASSARGSVARYKRDSVSSSNSITPSA